MPWTAPRLPQPGPRSRAVKIARLTCTNGRLPSPDGPRRRRLQTRAGGGQWRLYPHPDGQAELFHARLPGSSEVRWAGPMPMPAMLRYLADEGSAVTDGNRTDRGTLAYQRLATFLCSLGHRHQGVGRLSRNHQPLRRRVPPRRRSWAPAAASSRVLVEDWRPLIRTFRWSGRMCRLCGV